jgi:hypothetical protein
MTKKRCEHSLKTIHQCVATALYNMPEMPVRVDEMTPNEYKIFMILSYATGVSCRFAHGRRKKWNENYTEPAISVSP